LEETKLGTTRKVGRARHCSLGPKQLEDVADWIEAYRRSLEARLDRLGEFLDRTKGSDQWQTKS
jgi:hypothetical protein